MVYVPPRAAFLVLSAIICHLAKKISYLCTVKTNQRALAVFFDILIIKATSVLSTSDGYISSLTSPPHWGHRAVCELRLATSD